MFHSGDHKNNYVYNLIIIFSTDKMSIAERETTIIKRLSKIVLVILGKMLLIT